MYEVCFVLVRCRLQGTVRAAGRPGGGAGGAASGASLLSAAQPARQVASAAHSCVELRAMILPLGKELKYCSKDHDKC